ncbi:DUF5597 domain-containing protein [Silvibacterium acidisoli]|uniref:DUF5597 domain-containing protein n=1 Tax=Acidobacteriaceae bacterium ZG23-2 TaxID=2883246 RepID=UPI00406D1174
MFPRSLRHLVLLPVFAAMLFSHVFGQTGAKAGGADSIPKIVEQNGRHALLVHGKPYLMLGYQANNSSAWPDMLDKVFPVAATIHANTVEVPIYWEQVERDPGRYDFSLVDEILKQARQHRVHLVLLWFGTWKNGSSHYTPHWVKLDQQKYPFLIGKDGKTVDSPSTYSPARLAADKAAFAALMRHLRAADAQRTVLMVQVENEAGVWGGDRDHRPEAERDFAGQVPEKLVQGLGLKPGTWKEVFGDAADETFQAWAIASYIEQVAAAGKAEYPLPLYTNAALRDPFHATPGSYESGAPTDQNILLYQIAAPSLSLIAPDIYMPDYAKYIAVLGLYARFNNALMIPETGNSAIYAHYVFAAIGHGAIGFSPFGLDMTRYSNLPDGPEAMEKSAFKPFAEEYALLAPIADRIAAANLEGRVHGDSEEPDNHVHTLDLDRWQATFSYGVPSFGYNKPAAGNKPPDGGALVITLGPDEFLVTGHHVRVDFKPLFDMAKQRLFLEVAEGSYDEAGNWRTTRIWNGDQTDYGLNLKSDEDVLLRVKLTTF